MIYDNIICTFERLWKTGYVNTPGPILWFKPQAFIIKSYGSGSGFEVDHKNEEKLQLITKKEK